MDNKDRSVNGAAQSRPTQSTSSGDRDDWIRLVQRVQKKAVEIDQEHQVVSKTKWAAMTLIQKAREMNEQHQIISKAKEAASITVIKAKEFDREHHVVDRTAKAVNDVVTTTVEVAKGIDRDYHVFDNTKKAVNSTVTTAKQLDETHKISERTSKEISRVAQHVQGSPKRTT